MDFLEGETSAELRDRFVAEHLLPLARYYFDKHAEVQAVVHAVAQFWADEADDAVHSEFVPCNERDPKWPACVLDNPWFEEDQERPWQEIQAEWDEIRTLGLPQLDENTSMITAFAAFTKEGSDQEMETQDAYLPYAIVRRGLHGEDMDVEIVGKVLRPEWEDRFDVGFDAEEPDHEVLDLSALPKARAEQPADPTAKRPWWRRLFGG